VRSRNGPLDLVAMIRFYLSASPDPSSGGLRRSSSVAPRRGGSERLLPVDRCPKTSENNLQKYHCAGSLNSSMLNIHSALLCVNCCVAPFYLKPYRMTLRMMEAGGYNLDLSLSVCINCNCAIKVIQCVSRAPITKRIVNTEYYTHSVK